MDPCKKMAKGSWSVLLYFKKLLTCNTRELLDLLKKRFLLSALFSLVFDHAASPVCPLSLRIFSPLTEIDQHPHPIIKDVFNTLGPCIVDLIYSSLISGCVLAAFRHAVVQPWNPSNLDSSFLFNSMPISESPFLPKDFKKVVFNQLQPCLDLFEISKKFQSGFILWHGNRPFKSF